MILAIVISICNKVKNFSVLYAANCPKINGDNENCIQFINTIYISWTILRSISNK